MNVLYKVYGPPGRVVNRPPAPHPPAYNNAGGRNKIHLLIWNYIYAILI